MNENFEGYTVEYIDLLIWDAYYDMTQTTDEEELKRLKDRIKFLMEMRGRTLEKETNEQRRKEELEAKALEEKNKAKARRKDFAEKFIKYGLEFAGIACTFGGLLLTQRQQNIQLRQQNLFVWLAETSKEFEMTDSYTSKAAQMIFREAKMK